MSESILQEADRIINGQRRADYGPVEDSFVDIAARWTQELGKKLSEPLTPFDVVHLMVQLKLSRAKNGYHRDSYVDIGGYVGLTEKLQGVGLTPTQAEAITEYTSLADIPAGLVVTDKYGDSWRINVDSRWLEVKFAEDGKRAKWDDNTSHKMTGADLHIWDQFGPFKVAV
ncbi:hypothetical protein SEA_PHARAOH_52 [Mycobacterium phage Pharaoh]|uniref:DUF6378 domain-containing protein n=1 Tax=Mycobacterium phage Pharaoh TaxID=2530140 RepID=A0A481W347_9CAUD|nr:hypothetical protein KIV59_gp38 [Mycobacterium phage Pharaoh]QBJ00241.1 hypothetical protein SEA_PHARAOH_52 [Mycobacterium phage Pharaoh]